MMMVSIFVSCIIIFMFFFISFFLMFLLIYEINISFTLFALTLWSKGEKVPGNLEFSQEVSEGQVDWEYPS